jgi:hypothetical protein
VLDAIDLFLKRLKLSRRRKVANLFYPARFVLGFLAKPVLGAIGNDNDHQQIG